MALIKNRLLEESMQDDDPDADLPDAMNDFADHKKHPRYKTNLCRFCYCHHTVYYCAKCYKPSGRKLRKEKGPKGQDKYTERSYMHFCKQGRFAKHDCGNVPKCRSKVQMEPCTETRI